jgi:hypothetical protein
MRKLLIFGFFILILSSCGKKDNVPVNPDTVNPKTRNTNCVFSNFTVEQIQDIQDQLANTIKQKFGNEACRPKRIYQNLSSDLVFQILKYNRKADILGAIENNDLVGFITTIFYEPTCQFVQMTSDEINLAKQCQWGK